MRVKAEATRSRLKTLAQSSSVFAWSLVFRMSGQVLRPRVRTAGTGGGQRVAVIAPHPDDEIAGCGGTLREHRAAGDRVTVFCVTDGRRSTAFGLPPDEMAARRQKEAEAAAAELDVELAWLGLPEGRWRPDELIAPLREFLDREQPGVLYAPSRIDFHFEHERVARALSEALDERAPVPTVRVYAIQVPLTPVLTNVIVPVARMAEVERAMCCYETQLGSLLCCLRPRRYAAKFYGLPSPVEEFWEMSPAQYRRLHAQPRKRQLVKTFRGLRYEAASDPLAYLRGLKERWWLARQVRKT